MKIAFHAETAAKILTSYNKNAIYQVVRKRLAKLSSSPPTMERMINHLKTYTIRFALVIAGLLVFIGLSIFPVSADVMYKYRDKNGVLHFSNVPTSSKFRLYRINRSYFYDTYSTDAYDSIISDASNRHQVSFSLLKAIIKAESGFNPRAVSKKGALGLMQIMPQNVKALNVKDPFDPRDNIMAGARYFKQLYNRFNGKLDLALAAYNAGPKAVEHYKRIPPYRETKNYVKKVMRYYKVYRRG